MARWGITLPLTGVPLPAHRDLVRSLPDLGYTDVWTAETAGTDAFTPLALVAEWAPELRLGTAIAPVYTRGPGLLAMTAATIAELGPGPFRARHRQLVAGDRGRLERRPSSPSPTPVPGTRCGSCAAALAGEKVTEQYPTFAVKRFKLERPPAVARRDHAGRAAAGDVAVGGPRGRRRDHELALTGRRADRPRQLGDEPELAARIFVCPTEDADAARALGRLLISSYLTVPVYAAFHDWLGRGDVLQPMHEAWAAGDRKGANAVIPDEVVDDLIVHGSPQRCRERVAEYVANGLTTPAIAILPTGADPVAMVRALAPRADEVA